jgi:hypothetical protein
MTVGRNERATRRAAPPLFGGPIDPDKYDVRLTAEPKEIRTDRGVRLRIAEQDARHRRWRETSSFVAYLLGLVSIGVMCAILIFNPETSDQLRQWATGGLSAILAGATGYLAGKGRAS